MCESCHGVPESGFAPIKYGSWICSMRERESQASLPAIYLAAWLVAFVGLPFRLASLSVLMVLAYSLIAFLRADRERRREILRAAVAWPMALATAFGAWVIISSAVTPDPLAAFGASLGVLLPLFTMLPLGRAMAAAERKIWNLTWLLTVASLAIAAASALSSLSAHAGARARAFSMAENSTGTLFVIALALTFGCLGISRGASRAAAALAALMNMAALIGSGSRGAWLGAAVAMTVAAVRMKWARLLLGVTAAVAVVSLALMPGIDQRIGKMKRDVAVMTAAVRQLALQGLADAGTGSECDGTQVAMGDEIYRFDRFPVWAAGVHMVMDSPVFGWGATSYARLYPKYSRKLGFPQHALDGLTHAHNIFLEMAVSYGLPGAFLFLALVIVAIVRGARTVRRGDPLVGSVFLAFIGMLTHQMVDTTVLHVDMMAFLWLLGGVLLWAGEPVVSQNSPTNFLNR